MRKLLPLIGLTGVAAIAAALLLTMAALLPIGEARGAGGEHDAPTYTAELDFIWPPGGENDFSNTGTQTVGHEQGEPAPFAATQVCIDFDAAVHVVELSAPNEAAQTKFWKQMRMSGACQQLPNGLMFWPDEVMLELPWGDGDPMWIIKGHASFPHLYSVYIWMPVTQARFYGIIDRRI